MTNYKEQALQIQTQVQEILGTDEVYLVVAKTGGAYEVSNFGNVRSVDRVVKHRKGVRAKGFDAHYRGKQLKKCVNSDGYEVVCVRIDGERKYRTVHRLVGQAFIPNPDNLPEINHIDFDKSNNKVSNLEWCTPQYNVTHTVKNGRKAVLKGEDAPRSKLKNKDVLEIRKLLNQGVTQAELSRIFGVHKNIIWNISKGHTWKSA